MMKFELKLRRRDIPEKELADDLKRVAALINKDTVTKIAYDEKGKFGATTLLRRFGSWNKALASAGLKVVLTLNIENDVLFENLANVWQHLGRQPVGKDIDKSSGHSQYSLGTYEKRFGSWNKALEAFIRYIDDSGNQADVDEDKSLGKTEKIVRSGRSVRKINWRLRATVLIRDNCICRMCGSSPAKDSKVVLHVDHIKPWAKGGETELDNLQTLCSVCNIGKSDEIF